MLTQKITLALLACIGALSASAQDSLLLRDYQFVRQSDPWLTHRNAAALTRFAADNIVEAEASLVKGNGGLVNFDDSRNTLAGHVRAESFYRLSRRVVTFGAISYDNWTGRDMTGSAFMLRRTPFDLVEDSLTNPGRKHRDTYHLVGGVGADIYQGISLGARLDYTAANYAKYKDLRHKNKLMDLQLTLGTYIPVVSWLNIGADYTYHRQTESVDFGTYGKSERVYKTLIDYGAFMGRVEQFGNEGFTDKSREMPLFEDSHGASLQLEFTPVGNHKVQSSKFNVQSSIDFSHATGYYGRRSPYTITYTNHERDILRLQGRLTYAVRASRFTLDVHYASEDLTNRAETFRELTNASGANYYEYYDPVETGTKKWYDFSTLLRAQWGIRGELPTWDLEAGYTRGERRQSAYLYPYYRHQQLTTNTISLAATRNLLTRQGVWSFTLNAAWQKGSGEPYTDGIFALDHGDGSDDPSSRGNGITQNRPHDLQDAFLWREYQYLVAPQYTLGARVKYAFIFPGTRLKTHARLGIDYRKATETYDYSLGSQHTQLSLALGCTF
ncbi:MAG: hypothetical protein E7107_13365 [Prevotella sp.]|jgi:hypothetical protein|nr:hypothetical protein [Prevotella sp.]